MKNIVTLIFPQIYISQQFLHLMYSEVAWVLVFLRIQIHPQIIPNPDYLPDYLSVSYEYAKSNETIEGSKKMI